MLNSTKKVLKILNGKQKKQMIGIVILMFFGGIMESISVSLMLPLITSIMDDSTWDKSWYSHLICTIFRIDSQRNYIIVLLIFIIFIFIFKNIYLIMEYHVQYTFVARSRYNMQRDLIHSYLHKPYTFFLNCSTGEIVRIITSDTEQAFQLLSLLMMFYTEGIVCVILGITLFVMSPMMAVGLVIILSFEMYIITRCIKPVMNRLGMKHREESAYANKWMLESLGGIKSIKVSRKENYFEENYNAHAYAATDALRKNQVLNNVPRLIIEASTIAGALLLVLILVLCGRELTTLVPVLSAFVVAAVRLLPSTNRISSAINSSTYHKGGLDNILNVLDERTEDNKESSICRKKEDSFSFKDKIVFDHISFQYPDSAKNVLDNAYFEIRAGESVGMIGVSGGGKTTTTDIILGLLEPTQGRVLVDGIDIREHMNEWLSHVAYIPQTIFLVDDSIKANIAFGEYDEEVDEERIWKVLEEAKMDEFVRGLPEGLDTEIGENGVRLSGGQRQRIGIARALYNDPDILFFDEATSALDNETEEAVMESINLLKGKRTLVIIAHRLSTIENCDTIYRVEGGKIEKECD